MNWRAAMWTVVLCLGLLAWLQWDLMQMRVYERMHHYLRDPKTGARVEPRQLVNLSKILNVTDQYLNATNPMQRLYDLVYQTHLEGAFPRYQNYSDEEELRVSGWPASNQSQCGQQLDWIRAQLEAGGEYRLVKGKAGRDLSNLLDSFGKPESGTYSGLVYWTGSYTLCLRTSLKEGAIKTRYCVAQMRPKWWPEEERVFPKSRFKIAVCLPETCDTLSFARHKDKLDWLVKFDLATFYKSNLVFEGLYCLPDERSPMRRIPLAGRLLLVLIGAWLAVLLVASITYARRRRKLATSERDQAGQGEVNALEKPSKTAHLQVEPPPANGNASSARPVIFADPKKASRGLNASLEALALQANWSRFKGDQSARRVERSTSEGRPLRLDMRSVDFLRFLMAISIVGAHNGYVMTLHARSIAYRIELSMKADGLLLASVGRCVDTFFMLFGLFLSYNLLKRFPVERLSRAPVWLAANLNLLVRVGPLFVLTYCFARLVMPYASHGPWWDYGTYKYSLRGFCRREHWLKSVPYFGQWGEPQAASCVTPAWFVVSYAQIGLVAPLISYLIAAAPNQVARFALLAYVTLISGLQLALKLQRQTSFNEEAFTQYGGFLMSLLEKFQSTGTMAALGRVNCVAVGCYLGHLLRQYETGALRQWPRCLLARSTLIATIMVQVLVFVMPVYGQDLANRMRYQVGPNQFALGYTLANTLWLSSLAVQMVTLFTVHNRSWLARFAAHRLWHVLNKLSFCIFLLHFEVLLVGYTAYEQGPSLGFRTDAWRMFSLAMLVTLPLSLFVYLFFEAPITQLLKLLTARLERAAPIAERSTASQNANCKAAGP